MEGVVLQFFSVVVVGKADGYAQLTKHGTFRFANYTLKTIWFSPIAINSDRLYVSSF